MKFITSFSNSLTILLLLFTTVTMAQKQGNFIYTSPEPGAKFINPEQTLLFKVEEEFNKNSWSFLKNNPLLIV